MGQLVIVARFVGVGRAGVNRGGHPRALRNAQPETRSGEGTKEDMVPVGGRGRLVADYRSTIEANEANVTIEALVLNLKRARR